jgi:hypothetical protein
MGWMLHKLDFRNCTRLLVGGAGKYKWTVRILSVCKNVPNNFGHNLSLRQNWFFIPKTGFCVLFWDFFLYGFFLVTGSTKEGSGDRESLFSILWCLWTGNYPQRDLAKFGYRPHMKVFFKKGNTFIYLVPAGFFKK